MFVDFGLIIKDYEIYLNIKKDLVLLPMGQLFTGDQIIQTLTTTDIFCFKTSCTWNKHIYAVICITKEIGNKVSLKKHSVSLTKQGRNNYETINERTVVILYEQIMFANNCYKNSAYTS